MRDSEEARFRAHPHPDMSEAAQAGPPVADGASPPAPPTHCDLPPAEMPARVGCRQLWHALRALVQLDGGWLWVQDAAFRFTDITLGGPAQHHPIAEIAAGRRRWDLPLEEVSPEALAEHKAACERHEPFSSFEYRIRGADGRRMWFSVSGMPYYDDDGRFLGYIGIGRDVSAQHALQDEIWHWEQRLSGFAECSPSWSWEQDARFRYTRFWGQSIDKTHISVDRSIGRAPWELDLSGVSTEQMAAHRATLERHAAFHDFRYMLRTSDGDEEWFSISGRPIFDRSGTFCGYRGAGTCITAERGMRDSLSRYREVIAAVNEMTGGLTETQPLEEVLRAIVERAQALARTASGFVYLVEEDGKSMELVLALGSITNYLGVQLRAGEGLSGIVWQTGEALVVNDYDRWPWRSRKFQRSGIVSIAGVPLKVAGHVLGVLGVVHDEAGRRFPDSVVTSLRAFAPLASLALQHTRQGKALASARRRASDDDTEQQ